MIEWSDQAVILAKGFFHETDMWLKVLFREHGLATVFAFGASVSKRRFCGCLDIFNSILCKIKSSRNGKYLNLQEATLINGPKNLRSNWRNMGIAANCLRFLEAINLEGLPASRIYGLAEELRNTLEKSAGPHPLFPHLFRLHLTSLLGFAPNLKTCGECGSHISSNAFFRIDAGTLFCMECSKIQNFSRYDVYLPQGALNLLRAGQALSPSGWHFSSMDSLDRRACSKVIDGFIQYHLGLAWDKGDFRHV